ncbi:MAG: glucan 1,4-alpha-glucosidase [Gammaproteobacteria bacterium]
MNKSVIYAPGWPGSTPRWTSSAKSGVGTSLNSCSLIWFTLSHGILNEVYFPRLDSPCTRDLGLIVTDGHEFFSEEKRHATSKLEYPPDHVPLYRLINTCESGRYRIEKEILADPLRNVLLQKTHFTPLKGKLGDYHLYALCAPHLGNQGWGNTAWVDEYKGIPMLFAQRNGYALALACSVPWLKGSAGFVGASDAWQDLVRNKRLTRNYNRAENGNVALCGEIDLQACGGAFVLALGFGHDPFEAGNKVLASLMDGYDSAAALYLREWRTWHKSLQELEEDHDGKNNAYRISMNVLRTHESKLFRGALIASLSVPWGFAKSDNDLGGYHLAWPRDLVESAGGLLAGGAQADMRRILGYLQTTQESDGHWPQNMWMTGLHYWNGIQLDETAFPILLIDLAHREGTLSGKDLKRFWPMTLKAASYLACNGPVTQQDRWEEDGGYSPFTLAVTVAALLVAAELADTQRAPRTATYLRELADTWNDHIEQWTYVTNTALSRKTGVEGYYVRIAPPEECGAASPVHGFVPIKNRPPGQSQQPVAQIVSPDALALVRLGLRAANDPRIVNTVKVVDALLKVDTPAGPCWHRYNDDGYGEHSDGSPFDGTGHGRVWPLLTGERAHYELAAGRRAVAERLARTMSAFASPGGMLPEQVWDTRDIPRKELFFGKPSGSAMPLVWAHAEYVKLRRSLREERVFDMPPQPVERYVKNKTHSKLEIWRFNHKLRGIPAGCTLRIETLTTAKVHWSMDGWRSTHDTPTQNSGVGIHYADLPTAKLKPGAQCVFTFFWPQAGHWEGTDFTVQVA